ncbi:MAG: SPOR domain-containing protein [Pseudomonadota bacterium]
MNERHEFDDPGAFDFLGTIGPKAIFFIVLIALSFMVGLVWKLYSNGDQTEANVPIVRASEDPIRVEPEDRGGPEIAFQDSTLYNSELNDRRVENLFAEDQFDEPPIPRSQLFAGLNTQDEEPDLENYEDVVIDQTENINESIETFIEETVESAEETVEEVVSVEIQTNENSEVPKPLFEMKPDVKPIQPNAQLQQVPFNPKPQPIAKPGPQAAPQPIRGDYFIQLASVKSESAAETEWNSFVKKYDPFLSSMPHRVQRADLGDKGTFYRIQAGPISQTQANSICSEIKKINPNGCLVKKGS